MSIAENRAARGTHPRSDTKRSPSNQSARRRRRDEAVIRAEVQRLARALRPYGVLHRDMLERIAGTGSWHEGGFQDALSEAERTGRIAAVGSGYYRDADRRDPVDAA